MTFDKIVTYAKAVGHGREEAYSDKLLVDIITERVKEQDFFPPAEITMHYSIEDTNRGEVMIIASTLDKSRAVGGAFLRFIDLVNYDWKDYTKEAQRIARMLRKAFPDTKIKTNFR